MATIDEAAATSVIRELTVTSSDAVADCAAMLWPVDGPLSSGFGRREGKAHDGIDLAVAEQRRHVLEQDARLGEVGHVADFGSNAIEAGVVGHLAGR